MKKSQSSIKKGLVLPQHEKPKPVPKLPMPKKTPKR